MSEQEAERLYGPAPGGDEEPTANQYPSDPGETSRIHVPNLFSSLKVANPEGVVQLEVRGLPLTAEDLCGQHLGHQVRVVSGEAVYTDKLIAVKHFAEFHHVGTIFEPAVSELGRKSVRISFEAGSFFVEPGATVELLD